MCVGVYVGVCIDMCVCVYIDMYIDKCMGMHIDMFLDVHRHVYIHRSGCGYGHSMSMAVESIGRQPALSTVRWRHG